MQFNGWVPTNTWCGSGNRNQPNVSRWTCLHAILRCAGRLATLTMPRGPLTYAYHPTTGQLSTLTALDGGTLAYTYDESLLTGTIRTGAVAGTVSRTHDADLFGLALFLVVVVLGLVLIIGAVKRWPWIVNPPDEAWFWYSQAFIKKIFGPRVLLYFTYALGLATIAAGLYGLTLYWR